jgi:hypothetical protein
MAVDKIINSAISLIEQQPEFTKEAVANVWMLGLTIIADSLQSCTLGFEKLEELDKMDDFIFLEYSWQDVQSSVEASVSALRGVLNMMSTDSLEAFQKDKYTERNHHRRSSSISSGSSWIRKLSTVLTNVNGSGASTTSSRRTSLIVPNPNKIHDSLSAFCPTSVPSGRRSLHQHPTKLETIPCTPAVLQNNRGQEINPFEKGFEL